MKKEIDIVEDWLELEDEHKAILLKNHPPRMINEEMQLYSIGDMIEILNKSISAINIMTELNPFLSFWEICIFTGRISNPKKSFESDNMCNALWDCIKWCLKEGLI